MRAWPASGTWVPIGCVTRWNRAACGGGEFHREAQHRGRMMYPSVSKRRTVSPCQDTNLTAEGRDRLAGLMADGLSLRSIGRALARRRPSRASCGATRSTAGRTGARGRRRIHAAPPAHGGARDGCEARGPCHGPAQRRLDAGADTRTRLRLGIEAGLRAVCAETIHGWIYRAAQKTGRLWRFLTRHHARRRKRHGRASKDKIAEKSTFLSGLTTLMLA